MDQRTVFIPVEGGHLAATVAGIGAPVILLHGSDSNRSLMDPLIEDLRTDHRCLAPDRRGAGSTTAPVDGDDPDWQTLVEDVLSVVRWARARRPLVAGWSWGAKISLAYAAAANPCAGVFCMDGAAWGWDGSLHEDLYDRIACPIRMVFATAGDLNVPSPVYSPEEVSAFSTRHPEVHIAWLSSDHNMPLSVPGQVASLIRAFARMVQPT